VHTVYTLISHYAEMCMVSGNIASIKPFFVPITVFTNILDSDISQLIYLYTDQLID